jgi:hypothetical protein
MSNYTAIEEVGTTIINLLWDKMQETRDALPLYSTKDFIVLASPADIEDDDNVLCLFLYQVIENAHLKNQEMQKITSSKLRYPPLTLDLFYMLTSHAGKKNKQKRTELTALEHKRLGRAMQILHDNSILPFENSQHSGNEPDIREELRITLNPMSIDDMTKIWTTFQGKSYRPSACYLVTPVKIDSERDTSVKRVVRKEADSDQMVPKREEG